MIYDLVVVGGGLTGLVAAWECQKVGKNVMVLEARDRIGGRTLTEAETYKGQQSHFDLGAHFIGDELYQSTLWKLVQELGLKVFPQYDGPDKPVWTPGGDLPFWAGQGANLQGIDGKVSAYIGNTIPPTPAGQQYMGYLQELVESVPLSAPELTPNAAAYDKLSAWDWVSTIDLPGYGPAPDSFKLLTRMLCRVGFSEEPENIDMLWLLFYIASSGGLARFQALRWPLAGAQGYRLVEGAQSIAIAIGEKLQAKAPGCIKLGEEVASVSDDGIVVTVKTSKGEAIQGGTALIAMAPVLCSKIQFQPALPPARVEAAKNMPNPYMIMTYVTFDTAFWRSNTKSYPNGTVNGLPTEGISRYGLSGDGLLTGGPVVWVMDNTSAEGQPALFAFLVGDEARKLAKETEAQRSAAVLKVMTELFGDDVAANHPVYHEKDWNLDPFSAGCPASHFAPGAFFEYGSSVLLSGLGPKPHGNVYFGSTESSTISNGYMDGAVWSGQQVAIDILRNLGADVPADPAPLARSFEMEWCVKTILQAVEAQNPFLEFPALSDDVVFFAPGGKTLPSGPYTGKMGTIAFYELLGEYFTLSSVEVESISVDIEHNTAYATWTTSGTVNTNGNPFRDVKCAMVFEFNLQDQPNAKIVADWLFMDTALVDALAAAPPGPFSPMFKGSDGGAGLLAQVEGLAAQLAGSSKLSAPDQADFLIYGPGGTALPEGPYLGAEGHAEFEQRLDALSIDVIQTLGSSVDGEALTGYLAVMITGKSLSGVPYAQPLMIVVRLSNGPEPGYTEMRFFTNGLSFD